MAEFHFGDQIYSGNKQKILFKSSEDRWLGLTDVGQISVTTSNQASCSNISVTTTWFTGTDFGGYVNLYYTANGIWSTGAQASIAFSTVKNRTPIVLLQNLTPDEFDVRAYPISSTTGFSIAYRGAIGFTAGPVIQRFNYMTFDYGI